MARPGVLSAVADRAHLRDEGLILGSFPDVRRGRIAVVQVFQESIPDFVSACAVLNQRVCHVVFNLSHEAGDEHTGDLIGTEMTSHRSLAAPTPVTSVTKVQDR